MPSFSIEMPELERDMLRVLCHEYSSSAAHMIRQLVRAEYRSLYPEGPPKKVPLRKLDNAARGTRAKTRAERVAAIPSAAANGTGEGGEPGAPAAPPPVQS